MSLQIIQSIDGLLQSSKAATPSDSVFRALCTNLLTSLRQISTEDDHHPDM